MATFKEVVDSDKPFRHDATGPWLRFDKFSGRLVRVDGLANERHSDIITTFLATSTKWEVQEEPVMIKWYRPFIMWDTRKCRYVECREWFKSKDDALKIIHPAMVIVKWGEWLAPDLTKAF
jgi:hypothetical protein